jgi:hypothetical protein
MKLNSALFIAFLVCHSSTIKASHFDWKIQGEAGYYRASNSSVFNTNDLITRFEGLLTYKKQYHKHSWFLEFRTASELYGIENATTALKFSGKGQFQQRFSKLSVNFFLHGRKYFYNNNLLGLTFNIFQISGNSYWFFHKRRFLFFSFNYFYRDLENNTDNSLDAIVFTGKLYHSFLPFGKISAGIYLENFQVGSASFLGIPEIITKNVGWRFGPEIGLDYSQKVVININYRVLWHRSDLISNTSWEQWIRLLFGKLISRKWSIFFLVDYYFRDFPQPEGENLNLLYSPIENENRIYLKLEHDLQKRWSVFLKIGYIKDNLIYDNFSLSGLQTTVGLKIKD